MKTKNILKNNKFLLIYFLVVGFSIFLSIIAIRILSTHSNITNSLLAFPESSGLVSRLIFWEWLPILELLVACLGLMMYFRIDYLQHKKPLVNEDIDIVYTIKHHLKVVTLPKAKYYWRSLTYWPSLVVMFMLVFSFSFGALG